MRLPREQFRFCLVAAIALVLVARFPQPACSQGDEYAVKAAYLFNFGRTEYVQWPSDVTGKDFVLGILGPSPFGRSLAAIDGKPLRNLTTKVRFFPAVRDVTPCQILFVCGKDAKAQETLDAVLKAVKGQTTLVVAECEGALERGAAVRFTVVEECVRFEINPTAVANARLEMSAKVQRLAVRVLHSLR